MAGFIYFTEEQKRRANEVNLESFLLRQGERLLKSGREKRLASDHSITVRGNQWYDHAIEKGGGAIDFVKMFYGKDFPDAVQAICEMSDTYPENSVIRISVKREKAGKKESHLPCRRKIQKCGGRLPTLQQPEESAGRSWLNL